MRDEILRLNTDLRERTEKIEKLEFEISRVEAIKESIANEFEKFKS